MRRWCSSGSCSCTLTSHTHCPMVPRQRFARWLWPAVAIKVAVVFFVSVLGRDFCERAEALSIKHHSTLTAVKNHHRPLGRPRFRPRWKLQASAGSEVESGGGRYLALFDDYQAVKGPYFFALFDQLLELALATTNDAGKIVDETETETKTDATTTTTTIAASLPPRHMVVLTTRRDLELRKHEKVIATRNDNDKTNNSNPASTQGNFNAGNDARRSSESKSESGWNDEPAIRSWLQDLQSELELERFPDLIVMDDWNPLRLEQTRWLTSEEEEDDDACETTPTTTDHDVMVAPSVVWLCGTFSAYHTRHLLRTSGFDAWIRKRCCAGKGRGNTNAKSKSGNIAALACWIGEGAGAACAAESMQAPARARGDSASDAAEWQPLGLGLVSDDEADRVAAVLAPPPAPPSNGDGNGNGESESESESKHQNPNANPKLHARARSHAGVYAWAQPPSGEATRFVLRPSQNGAMEDYRCDLDPLPALDIDDLENDGEREGVACWGEPSIDPSRAAQAGGIGGSEWWEE